MMDVPTKACWTAHDVKAVIGNEALEGHEGAFLATHTPIVGFEIAGSHAADIAEPDESAVLRALSNSNRRHAFCIVQGEPGSGKSHLIRWLAVTWPVETDVKLLLQRADGSLEGALRQLREQLRDFHDLFENLGQLHRATLQGRANTFHSNLANALDPDHFDPPLEDVEWCRSTNPSELVNHFHVKRAWGGPLRVLRLLEGKSRNDDEKARNSESAAFDVFDIAELADCCRNMRGTGVLPATEVLAGKLVREAETIKDLHEKGWTAAEIERERNSELRTSLNLLAALNRRRNDAIQNLLGVSADSLKRLFRQVRERLAQRNQRLVLLLEDITSWEGIDDSLIDVLVTNAETRGSEQQSDMCPLISVVGVTPAYYSLLHGNYRGRITHELSLGKAPAPGSLQDVATLRDPQSRQAFAARYLAAVRTGENALDAWREGHRANQDIPPPNPCHDCHYREGCHKTFGAHEDIGLFPFTPSALERIFQALNDNDSGMTWKTPRGILQAILNPNLSRPSAIEDREFPTHLIETRSLLPESKLLSPRLDQTIDIQTPEPERARTKRLIAYWGDKERADTTRSETGEIAFAGVLKGVFESFGIAWIGDNEPLAQSPHGAVLTIEVDPTPLAETPKPPTPAPRPEVAPIRGRPFVAARSIDEPPSKRNAPSKSELEKQREQLRIWKETGALEAPSTWNQTLYSIVQNIDPRAIGLDPCTYLRLLTPERVKFEGTGPANRAYFMVKPEAWVLNGLEGFVALRLDRSMTANDAAFHWRNLAIAMRRLERRLSEYADARLSLLPDGRRWHPVSTIAQILLTRAWLRGSTTPMAPPQAQLKAILSDEPEATTDPTSRCTPWQEFLNRTKDWHDSFRRVFRDMLGTPQGISAGFGLADVSIAAGAILRFRDNLEFDRVPPSEFETGVNEFDKARDIIDQTGRTLLQINRIECDQIRGRADVLNKNRRHHSIRSHVNRIDSIVDTVDKLLPGAAPDRVKEWKTALARLKPRIEAGADTRVEELLIALSPLGEGTPDRRGPLLEWLIHVPARDLEDVRDLSQKGEAVVGALLPHTRDCIAEGRGSASLDNIRSIGQKLKVVADKIGTREGIE